MDVKKIVKWVGIGATVVGAALLFVSGTPESQVMAIVGAVFIGAGVIAAIIKS